MYFKGSSPSLRYISISLPGHDDLEMDGILELDGFVEYVNGFITTLKYEKLSIIGFYI